MQGFDDAINGRHDVADQLGRYLLSRVSSQSETTRERLASIDSREAHESYREDVRTTLLSRIGGLPARPETLSTETTGRTERDGYTVENVVVESHPDHHVTGNCYVPDAEGPHSAVLFLCGHLAEPRPDSLNQRACIELALNGFVVLIIDPLGQGERTQYVDFDPDETTVSGGGGVFPHAYVGQKCHYAGTNLLRHMLHDDRCGVDYLQSRDDVDAGRIGVTGTSGGGLQTLYLALVDDRIDAVAPCCSLSRRTDQVKTGHRSHGEQAVPGGVGDGIDYNDVLAALAPLPVCVGAANSDRYFPIEGVHETVEEARGIYELHDAADRLTLVVGRNQHCSVDELDDVVPWLCAQLGDGYEAVPDPEPLDADAVRCTQNGSVREAYSKERTVDELLRESVTAHYPETGKIRTATDGDAERIQNTVTTRLGLDRNGCSIIPRYIDSSEEDGLAVEYLWFKTERNPDAVVAGILVTDPEQTTDAAAVVLWENGTADLPDRSDELARVAREHGVALLFDPRGVGAVRNRMIPVPDWVSHYHGVWGTEFKLANDALLLGESLLGMRVYDCIRAAEFIQSETRATDVSFVGEGTGAYHALYAAAAADDVAQVSLRDLGPSFYEMATNREVPPRPSLAVYDVVGDCDLPHLFAALDQRGVRVERPDGEKRPSIDNRHAVRAVEQQVLFRADVVHRETTVTPVSLWSSLGPRANFLSRYVIYVLLSEVSNTETQPAFDMPKLAAPNYPVVSWRDIFGHPEAYPEQRDGIEAAIDAAENDGFVALEGACGTGKTMLALSAGVDRVRDPDSSFERVVVLTSVKQQLRQFEADLRTINGNLPEEHDPVSGLTLVGKADVCPYARENRGGVDDENVYDRCEGLRERTRNLVGDGGPTTAAALADDARSQQVGIADSGSGAGDYLETAGEPTPYRPDTEKYGGASGGTEYCPFYAQYLADLPEDGDPAEAVPFDFTDKGLIDTEELVRLSAGHGTCPHSVMGAVLGHVEVVVGNYYYYYSYLLILTQLIPKGMENLNLPSQKRYSGKTHVSCSSPAAVS